MLVHLTTAYIARNLHSCPGVLHGQLPLETHFETRWDTPCLRNRAVASRPSETDTTYVTRRLGEALGPVSYRRSRVYRYFSDYAILRHARQRGFGAYTNPIRQGPPACRSPLALSHLSLIALICLARWIAFVLFLVISAPLRVPVALSSFHPSESPSRNGDGDQVGFYDHITRYEGLDFSPTPPKITN